MEHTLLIALGYKLLVSVFFVYSGEKNTPMTTPRWLAGNIKTTVFTPDINSPGRLHARSLLRTRRYLVGMMLETKGHVTYGATYANCLPALLTPSSDKRLLAFLKSKYA